MLVRIIEFPFAKDKEEKKGTDILKTDGDLPIILEE